MEIGHEIISMVILSTADSSGAVVSYWRKYLQVILNACAHVKSVISEKPEVNLENRKSIP